METQLQTPKEILDKVKGYAKADSSDYFANVAKGTLNGAVTGALVGGVFGYYKKFNIYGSVLAGLLVGGVVSNFLIKYKN